MKEQPHEGQILAISDLSVLAIVTEGGNGRNADDNGDCFRIREINPDRMGAMASAYSYLRQDGAGWTDCHGEEPVTVELIHDAPKPRRVGKEEFFGEIVVAICEGYGLTYLPQTSAFAEAVRNHVATENPGIQWERLATATLRHGRVHLYEVESFIEEISKLDAECLKVHTIRQERFDKRHSA